MLAQVTHIFRFFHTDQKESFVRCLGIYSFVFQHLGWVLLDRSGKHFNTVLNYLRDGSVPLPDSPQELEELLVETRFYCLEGLRRMCEEKLEKLIADTQDKPHAASIIIVKYPKVTKAIFASTKKVSLLFILS